MPRAKIPYDAIRSKLRSMFPEPAYRFIRLRIPDRYNKIKAPTTIYDRTSGNFQTIGYRCDVVYEIFTGFSSDLRAEYSQVRKKILVEI